MPRSALLLVALLVAVTLLPVAHALSSSPSPSRSPRAFTEIFKTKLDRSPRDGVMTMRELQDFAYHADPHPDKPMPSLEKLQPLLDQWDLDGDGEVHVDEFVSFMVKLAPDAAARLLALEDSVSHAALAAAIGRDLDASSNAPAELHLSLTSQPGSMVVMWITAANYSDLTPRVTYAPVSNPGASQTATGSSTTYNVGMFVGFHSAIHTVVLTGLTPGAQYTYTAGGNGSAWSAPLEFRAAPATWSGNALTPFSDTWLVFGDQGTIPFGSTLWKNVIEPADAAAPFSLLLLAGDIAYAGFSDHGGEFEPLWSSWFSLVEPFSSTRPLMPSHGNHDALYNSTAYQKRFTMPSPEGVPNRWWSFDQANAHVTSFSTEDDYSEGSEQFAWIEQDLAMARQRNVTWLFLMGHRPLMSSDMDEYDSHNPTSPNMKTLEPLLLQFGVDLVITGHMHCAEITFPTRAGVPVVPVPPAQNGTTSVVYNAPLGAPVYIVQGNAGALIEEKWVTPAPVWSAFRSLNYGYGQMSFDSSPTPLAAPSPCAGSRDQLTYQAWTATGTAGLSGTPVLQYEFTICKA